MERKRDAFAEESQVLQLAKSVVNDASLSSDQWREKYVELVESYERLLEEAKFLTKNADRLEKRLHEANEQLERQKRILEKEYEESEKQKEVVLQTNKKLAQEKTALDTQVNRVQMILIILIAVLVVIILFMLYYLVWKPKLEFSPTPSTSWLPLLWVWVRSMRDR
ncbi:MAG: hypothetical protein ACUVRD_03485 [Bacteroidia bacterium]